ncbi:hypothetical protein B7494_g3074 [Chlorociboria aeruginascens]|nr:hypothetical protein B7494_g3074 [Chlorociboria aeruginascens]
MSQPSGAKHSSDSKDKDPKDSEAQKVEKSTKAELPTWVRGRYSTRESFYRRNNWVLRSCYQRNGPLVRVRSAHSNVEAYEIPRRNIIEKIRNLPTPLAAYTTSDFSPDETIDPFYQANIDKYKPKLRNDQAANDDDNDDFIHCLVLNCISYFPSERPTPEPVSITCQQGIYPESKRKDCFLLPLTAEQKALIPSGLSEESQKVYHTLITVAEKRSTARITPVNLLVITDLAKDYDDLTAMVILKELHRLGLIVLKGFVANLDPAQKRACFGRGALDSLGLGFVPIARGTKAQTKDHPVDDYEFDCSFMAPEDTVFEDGYNLIESIYLEAQETSSTVSLLLISSLTDISNAATGELNQLMADYTRSVTLQGGYTVTEDNELVPNNDAANNNFDFPAAQRFHKFIHDARIPSIVYTKVAAFATPLFTNLFTGMEDTGHPIGAHLRRVEVTQDIAFYKKACLPPEQRFRPFMDRDWFLKSRTSWYDEDRGDQPFPEGDEIVPYLTKIVAYDALAAVGSAGCDVLDALGVLKQNSEDLEQESPHKIIGIQGVDDGVNGEKMANAIYSLLLGSLLACQQRLDVPR